jgi:hypothetical protein
VLIGSRIVLRDISTKSIVTLLTEDQDPPFISDAVIFGGSSHVLVSSFQETMEKEFQMFMMGELTFFLCIRVKQMKQGTFVHQTKYTKDLMKKFNMAKLKPVSTLMSMATALDSYENGEAVDQREYKSMIDSLLYLTATQPDI